MCVGWATRNAASAPYLTGLNAAPLDALLEHVSERRGAVANLELLLLDLGETSGASGEGHKRVIDGHVHGNVRAHELRQHSRAGGVGGL